MVIKGKSSLCSNYKRKALPFASLCTVLFLWHCSAAANVTWINSGNGFWSVPTNWSSNPSIPSGSGINVDILNGASNVTLDTYVSLGSLQIASGNTLTQNPNTQLAVYGPQIINNGQMVMNGGGGTSTYLFMNGDTTLSGAGTLTLHETVGVGSHVCIINGTSGTKTLTNQSTIQGDGNIGSGGRLGINNSGTINANSTAGPLSTVLQIYTYAGVSNTGLLEATNSGVLQLYGDTINNNGGNITANGANATVQIYSSNIQGGALNALNGGALVGLGTSTLDGSNKGALTINGQYTVSPNTQTSLLGTIYNTNNIQINGGGGANTYLWTQGDTTLTGGGTVTLNNTAGGGGGTYLYNNVANATLTNVDNTIQGSGLIGNTGSMALVNRAGGTINANSTGGTHSTVLQITAANGTTNQGLMEASNSGVLELSNYVIDNAGGTIQANSGSTVQLDGGVTVRGGTLTNNGGTVQGVGTSFLDGSTAFGAVKIAGEFTGIRNSQTHLKGAINNTGNLQINGGGGANTYLFFDGNTALTGGGTVTLNNTAGGGGGTYLYNTVANATLTNVDNTIQGSGFIGYTGGMTLVNQAGGTINANSTGGTQSTVLQIAAANGTTNQGLMEASNSGVLELSNYVINNAGGNIQANSGSTVQLDNSVTVQSGTLTNNGGTVQGVGTSFLDGGTVSGAVKIVGEFTGIRNSQTHLKGAINNTGNLQINGGGGYNTYLFFDGNTALTGGGTVTLNNTAGGGGGTYLYNYIANDIANATLTNVDNTIQGSGFIGYTGGMTLVNQAGGTINANSTGGTQSTVLQIAAANGTINQGLMEASNSGVLELSNYVIYNAGGTIQANSGSTVQLDSGVRVQGGTLTNNGGTMQGVGTSFLDGGIFPSDAVKIAGEFTGAGNSQTHLTGAINNTGNLQINGGGGYNTYLFFDDFTMLRGGGTVTLNNTAGGGGGTYMQSGGGGTLLYNWDNTIQGAGFFGQGTALSVANSGVITANVTGQALTMNSGSGATITNAGILQAANGGYLVFLQGLVITNQTGGVVEALANSAVEFSSGAAVTNLSGNTLTGGIWKANSVGGARALIDFGPRTSNTIINTNNADIYLIGTGSEIRTFIQSLDDTLFSNNGSLRLQQGRTFNARANIGNFSNAGLLEVTDSTFQSNTLASNGAISGFGASTVNTGTNRITGAGTITANTGSLTLTGGVNMGTGSSMTSNAGAAIDLHTATLASYIGTLNNNGSLNLGTQNINVSADYTNANFGVGNSFNNHANVAGTGQILATGNVGISLSGAGITNGTSASPTLALGNVHVGAANNGTFNINNTGSNGPVIRGAIQNSGAGIAAQNFGPIALGGSSAVNYDYTANTSGLLNSSFNIVTNFDNVTGKTVNVTGAAYNLAQGSSRPSPVTLANQRVGGTGSQILTVTNTGTAGAYTEGLNATFGANTGNAVNNGGMINLLAVQGSNNSAMAAGVDTATAGHRTGKVTLNYTSDGTGTSGLGTTSVGSETITVSGDVYRLAQGDTTTSAVNFGNRHVGDAATQALTVRNTAAADGYSEKLNASFGAATGAATDNGGSISLLAAGNSNNSAMTVGLNTGSAGHNTGTVSLNYFSDGTGTSGLSAIAAGNQTVNVSGDVYRLASANSLGAINFGNVHVGDSVAQQALTISNTAVADGYSERLNAGFGTLGAGITTNGGSITNLAAGESNNTALKVGIDTASAGAINGTAQVNLASDGNGTSNLGLTTLSSQSVAVTGGVYNLAQSNTIAPLHIVAHVGDGGGHVSQALSITNIAPAGAFSEGLDSTFGSYTAGGGDTLTPTFTGSITNLQAGSTDNTSMKATINTSTAGLFNGSVVVNQASNGTLSGLSNTALASQDVGIAGTVTGGIFNYAVATVTTSQPIDFGNVRQGSSLANQALSISNTGPVSVFTEALNGSVVSAPAGFTATGSFSGLQATSPATADTSISVGMNTTLAGHQAGNVVLGFVSDGTGIQGDGSITALNNQNVAVTGNVYRLASPTVNTPSINLFARVGDVSPTASVSLTNSSPDSYTEGLNASIGTSSSSFTAGGGISNLAAQQTAGSALHVGLATGTAGSFAGSADLTLVSTGAGTTGASDLDLTGQSVSLNGKVYTPAVAQLANTTIDFGIVHKGDSVAAKALNVTNGAAPTALNDLLTGGFNGATGPFTAGGTLSGLTAGAGNNSSLTASLNTANAGVFSSTATASFQSHNADMTDLNLGNTTITLNGQVNNYANPVFKFVSGDGIWSTTGLTYTLNFGQILQGSGIETAILQLMNDVNGPADLVDGTYLQYGTGFQLSGFNPFVDLSAGYSINGLSVVFNAMTLGSFTETLTLSALGHNISGYSDALPDITLIVQGDVIGQQPVPEPSTFVLAGLGLLGLGLLRRKNLS